MNIKRCYLISSVFTIFTLLINSTFAAVPANLGTRANPLTSTESLRRTIPEPLTERDEIVLPILTEDFDLGKAKEYKFKLKKVAFKGNKAISSQELAKPFAQYISKTIKLGELIGLVKATTKLYRDKGYILSQAFLPEQKINKDTGEIKVSIIEGFVNDVKVSGSEISLAPTTKYLLKQYGERLKSENPLTQETLERYALLADDLSGGNMKVVFFPSKNVPGAADVEFIAENHQLAGAELYHNNRGTRILGPEETSGTIYQYNGFYGNRTFINKVRTDNHEMKLMVYGHKQPLNDDGLAFNFVATRAKTKPDFAALPALTRTSLETPGISNTYLGQLEYPVIRSREQNLLVHGKLDFSNNESTIAGLELFNERLRTIRVGFIYDWLDPWVLNVLSESLVGVEFSQGIHGLGSHIRPSKRLTTRPKVDDKYTKINFTVSRIQPLVENVFLRLLGLGQLSFDPLVSSEEFGFGGRIMGLGYDPYQVSGDHGVAGKVELSYIVPVAEFIYNIKTELDLKPDHFLYDLISLKPDIFVFYDAGRVWNKKHRDSFQKEHDSAVSAGYGIRGSIFKYLIYEGYMAKPLTRVAENEQDKKSRYFFSIGISAH